MDENFFEEIKKLITRDIVENIQVKYIYNYLFRKVPLNLLDKIRTIYLCTLFQKRNLIEIIIEIKYYE